MDLTDGGPVLHTSVELDGYSQSWNGDVDEEHAPRGGHFHLSEQPLQPRALQGVQHAALARGLAPGVGVLQGPAGVGPHFPDQGQRRHSLQQVLAQHFSAVAAIGVEPAESAEQVESGTGLDECGLLVLSECALQRGFQRVAHPQASGLRDAPAMGRSGWANGKPFDHDGARDAHRWQPHDGLPVGGSRIAGHLPHLHHGQSVDESGALPAKDRAPALRANRMEPGAVDGLGLLPPFKSLKGLGLEVHATGDPQQFPGTRPSGNAAPPRQVPCEHECGSNCPHPCNIHVALPHCCPRAPTFRRALPSRNSHNSACGQLRATHPTWG